MNRLERARRPAEQALSLGAQASGALALGALALLAGCAATPMSGADAPAQPPSVKAVAPAAAPAKPAAPAGSAAAPPAEPAAAVKLEIPPPLTEPLQPLTRSFASFSFPGVVGGISAIGGTGSKDLWLIAGKSIKNGSLEEWGVVYHYDGQRSKSYGHPCFAANFSQIVATKDTVVAVGFRPWSRGVAPPFRIALGRDGKWPCDYADIGFSSGFTVAAGEKVWQLSCLGGDCTLETAGGPAAPVPRFHETHEDPNPDDRRVPLVFSAFHMRGADDGYLVREGEDRTAWLFRYNGVTWKAETPLPAGLSINSLWTGDEGHAWILARSGGKDDDPANLVVRWDGRAFTALAVPKDFAALSACGTSASDVFFFGTGKAVYQWDGQRLRKGETPFNPADTLCLPRGDVWIVGATSADDPNAENPLAARLPAPEVKR
jgi:hypothetical protein